MALSAWRTSSTRSTQLEKTFGLPRISCCLSSCQWLVMLLATKPDSWRTWETPDFVARILTPSSGNWTKKDNVQTVDTEVLYVRHSTLHWGAVDQCVMFGFSLVWPSLFELQLDKKCLYFHCNWQMSGWNVWMTNNGVSCFVMHFFSLPCFFGKKNVVNMMKWDFKRE